MADIGLGMYCLAPKLSIVLYYCQIRADIGLGMYCLAPKFSVVLCCCQIRADIGLGMYCLAPKLSVVLYCCSQVRLGLLDLMLENMTQARLHTHSIGDQSPRSSPVPVMGFASDLEGLVYASACGGLVSCL